MGKGTLLKGVLTGAVVGGLVTLADDKTRAYVTSQLRLCGNKATYYTKHPSEAVQRLNENYEKCSQQFSSSVSTVLDTLNYLQETTSKTEKREKHE